jgi:endonuclease YncB( thermonuclease family)
VETRKLGRTVVRRRSTLSIALLVIFAVMMSCLYFVNSITTKTSGDRQAPSSPNCRGVATCFSETVTHIVDGDTLDVGSTRIRLALVNTPEVGQPGYSGAKQFTAGTCPVGSQAFVDQDDGQTGGS